jgi:tetratricopeptide (TPR) repeat protein
MNTLVKFLFFFIISFISLSLSGNSIQDSAVVYLQQANEAYQSNNYEEAVALYTKVLDLQYESASLFYNIGNAYFKSGENARALLWLERAQRLDPNNEDINHNIAFVQQKLIDKIEVLPELFIVKWWNACSNLFTGNKWATISIVSRAIFALCFLLIL